MLFWIKLLIFLPVNKSYYVRVNFHLWCWLVVMHRSMFLNLPNHISLRIVSASVGFKIPISIQIQPMLFCFITNVLVHFKQYIEDGIVGSSMIEQPNSNNSFAILEVPVTTIIRKSCIVNCIYMCFWIMQTYKTLFRFARATYATCLYLICIVLLEFFL